MILTCLKWFDSLFAKIMKYILVIFMVTIPVICGLDVVFRYFIKKPLHGSEEIVVLLAIWLYFLGFTSAAREKCHITARVLESTLKTNEAVAKLRMVDALIAIFIASYLVGMAWDYFLYALKVGKTTAILYYPMILYESAPLFCLIPLVFYTIAEFVFYAKKIKKSDIDFIAESKMEGSDL